MPLSPSSRGAPARRPLVHPLAGSRSVDLVRTLVTHRGVAARHAGQVALMFLCALARSPFSIAEQLQVGSLDNNSFDPPPLFIVGHWRSGTTFLNNLLSRDPGFCFPTITDVLRPYGFYPSPFEFISRNILLKNLPAVRPMDDVPFSPDFPQEDELALATMGAPSFFNSFYFPRLVTRIFAEEVLLKAPGAEQRWQSNLRYFLGKLAALSPGRRLLVKNPAHSARILPLRKLFPGAKFIHIHRDPLEVIASTRRLYRRLLPMLALQRYDLADIDAHIVESYLRLMYALCRDTPELPAGDYAEIRYSVLVANPVKSVAGLYERLGLDGFGRAEAAIAEFAARLTHNSPPVDLADRKFAALNADRVACFRSALGYGDSGSPTRYLSGART